MLSAIEYEGSPSERGDPSLKWQMRSAEKTLPQFKNTKVSSCFNDKDVKNLAQLLRNNYSSCVWQQGDILLVDNKKIIHAGMPGAGPRLIRALIGNPLAMSYEPASTGCMHCHERTTETIGFYMNAGDD